MYKQLHIPFNCFCFFSIKQIRPHNKLVEVCKVSIDAVPITPINESNLNRNKRTN